MSRDPADLAATKSRHRYHCTIENRGPRAPFLARSTRPGEVAGHQWKETAMMKLAAIMAASVLGATLTASSAAAQYVSPTGQLIRPFQFQASDDAL